MIGSVIAIAVDIWVDDVRVMMRVITVVVVEVCAGHTEGADDRCNQYGLCSQ